MIAKTKAYTDSTGAVHGTLESAQNAELSLLFPMKDATDAGITWVTGAIVETILTNADKVRDVLSTRPSSRPGTRKVNKGKAADAATVKKGLAAARKAADTAVAA